jgi:hypothetical protein
MQHPYKSDEVIAQELRVRYFTHLRPIDNVTRTSDARAAQIPLWTQADGYSLLPDSGAVSLNFEAAGSLVGSIVSGVGSFGSALFRQTNHGIHRANVSAGLSEIGHFAADDLRWQVRLTQPSAIAMAVAYGGDAAMAVFSQSSGLSAGSQ